MLATTTLARYEAFVSSSYINDYGNATMQALWQSFLVLLATATDRELAQVVEYLTAENRILRSRLPRTVDVTAGKKRSF